jgi:cell division protein FtsB
MNTLLRQLGFVAAAAVTCFYVFLVLRGPNGIPAMLEKRQQIERMKQENEAMRQEIEKKKIIIDQLENSSEARERAVREHTRKAKQHETTIFLQDEDEKSNPQD